MDFQENVGTLNPVIAYDFGFLNYSTMYNICNILITIYPSFLAITYDMEFPELRGGVTAVSACNFQGWIGVGKWAKLRGRYDKSMILP